ncbi:MAG: hypothetical protein U5K71_13925 [Gracilimonas sp.]|nr:hypothetical protein [Gracilimonas sp.]
MLRQLTFGGDNAEAYWSYDSEELIFQSNNPEWGVECDQIFTMDISEKEDGFEPTMISTGNGRTTCAYFLPGDSTFVYSSTHETSMECPQPPERGDAGAYVWPIYDTYDIYKADMDGRLSLPNSPTNQATMPNLPSLPKGDKIVFTSDRSGDLELYIMDTDGSNINQITDELGYDGGAFFSPDGTQLIFRASRPETDEEINNYKTLLKDGLVEPTNLELFIINIDGTGLRQITDLGNANWAPYFHPSGEKVVFSSNHQSQRGFPFNIFMINVDGTGLEQITFDDQFDSFPMFSPDGKKIVFSSNRNNGGNRSTNVFVADWVD